MSEQFKSLLNGVSNDYKYTVVKHTRSDADLVIYALPTIIDEKLGLPKVVYERAFNIAGRVVYPGDKLVIPVSGEDLQAYNSDYNYFDERERMVEMVQKYSLIEDIEIVNLPVCENLSKQSDIFNLLHTWEDALLDIRNNSDHNHMTHVFFDSTFLKETSFHETVYNPCLVVPNELVAMFTKKFFR